MCARIGQSDVIQVPPVTDGLRSCKSSRDICVMCVFLVEFVDVSLGPGMANVFFGERSENSEFCMRARSGESGRVRRSPPNDRQSR